MTAETQYRVLAVDDEEDELRLFERFLGKDGYEVVTTASSREAIEKLRGEHWDVLITDIYMPGHDGFDVIRTGVTANPSLRCIAVTGYGSEKVLENVLEHNCFGYVNKPFDWEYLRMLVKRAVQPSSRRSGRKESGRNRNTK